MKKVFFDLETTGVKHWRNGVHQLAGVIVYYDVTNQEMK